MNEKFPARHFEKLDGNRVRCLLCSKQCVTLPGKKGFCKSRINEGGELYTLNYGNAVAINMDPIEKKPLYHFLPGSLILSLGTNFCNLACKFCQNHEISQHKTNFTKVNPDYILSLARQSSNCCGVAFTYNEPAIWFEFVYDCARILHAKGLKTVMVTNGDISEQALRELAPYIDAMNIDLKSFSDKFYRDICGNGSLEAVANTIRLAWGLGIHVEVTNLLIPTLNDSNNEISNLVDFVSSVSPDIPLHFSRYHPSYLCEIQATPVKTLNMAYEIGAHKLKFVYLGNVSDIAKNSTHCPSCRKLLIKREYFSSAVDGLSEDGCCDACGEKIYGTFH